MWLAGNSSGTARNFDSITFYSVYVKSVGFFSVKRTQVIDDESDYFSTDSNQWLKDSEKAALRKREEELRGIRHASRKDRKVMLTLDFAGRQVVEEERGVDMYNASDSLVQKINFSVSDDQSSAQVVPAGSVNENIVNPNINRPPPKVLDLFTVSSTLMCGFVLLTTFV